MIRVQTACLALCLCAASLTAQAASLVFVTTQSPAAAPLSAGAAALLADACAPVGVFVVPWSQGFYAQKRAGQPASVARLVGAAVAVAVECTEKGDATTIRLQLHEVTGRAVGTVEAQGADPLAALAQALTDLQKQLAPTMHLAAPRWPPTQSAKAFREYAEGIAAASQPGGAPKAEPHFRSAIQADRQFAPAQHELGAVLWDLGRRDEAVQAYRAALTARPDSAMTHNNLGVALMRTDEGTDADAQAELQAALASSGDPAAVAFAHVSLGNLLRQDKDYAAAEKEYETARRLMPQHPAPLLNLGVTAMMRKDNVAAEGLLRRVAAMRNERRAVADAHRLLGDLSLREARFDQAVVEYQQALEARPDYAFAHCNLGAAYRKLKQLAEAAAEYRRAIELDNDAKATGAAHNNLGNLLMHELNRPAEAAEQFRKALQYDPGNATIQKNLERVQGKG